MNIKAITHKAEEGSFWAEVPALPGCVTQGETMDKIKSNLRVAVEGWLLVGNDAQTDEPGTVLGLAV